MFHTYFEHMHSKFTNRANMATKFFFVKKSTWDIKEKESAHC
jgi:hypothetical protein